MQTSLGKEKNNFFTIFKFLNISRLDKFRLDDLKPPEELCYKYHDIVLQKKKNEQPENQEQPHTEMKHPVNEETHYV